jgi:histidine ammonia-lyase
MVNLARTRKFKVWSPMSGVNTSPVKRSTAATVVVGGRKVTVSDLARVAVLMYNVTLDVSTIEKIDADLATSKTKVESSIPELINVAENDHVTYDISFCRAALFARVVSLMQGRSGVRSEVVECLVEMLEANVIPNFSSSALAGLELCAALTASGASCSIDGVIMSSASAFALGGIEPIALSAAEVSTIKRGQFFSTGCTCLIASGAANLGVIVDCISALSCDTFGVNVEPFDSVHFDSCRQHRGQIASATNLRLLLEGSKRTLATNTSSASVDLAFASIPQVHGPAQESTTSTVK